MDGEQFEEYLERIKMAEGEEAKQELANELLQLLGDENTQVTSASSSKEGSVDFLMKMTETISRARAEMDDADAFVLFVKSTSTVDEEEVTWKSFIAGASVEDYFSLVLCCKTMLELLADTLSLNEEDDDAIT